MTSSQLSIVAWKVELTAAVERIADREMLISKSVHLVYIDLYELNKTGIVRLC